MWQDDVDLWPAVSHVHACMYLVQGQVRIHRTIFLTIVYTEKQHHVERIRPDTSFMQENLSKVRSFFEIAILPELHGRWFTRPLAEYIASTGTTSDTNTADMPKKYCYCQEVEHGDMVGCDNSSCPFEWFHLECLKLKHLPKSKK